MNLDELMVELAEQSIENDSLFLVDVLVKGKPGNQKIQVFVDGDDYVDIDECSKISRRLSDELEERDVIEGKYVIEVSSPGADRPLKLYRQYHKHIGRELEVATKSGRSFQGTLLDTADESIELSISSSKLKKELQSETVKLPIEDVDSSKVVIRL